MSRSATSRGRRRTYLLVGAAALGLLLTVAVAGVGALAQPTCQVRASPSPHRASPTRLEADVVRIVEGFGPRGYDDPEGLDAVAGFLAEEFERAGGRVRMQRYDVPVGVGDLESGTFANVIARFGPQRGPVIVVGAHYDAADGLAGADDNASGTAGLLELGRLLGAGPPLSTTVELVAYSTEEPPHFRSDSMGSAVHVARALEARMEIRAMICLEMLGASRTRQVLSSIPSPGSARSTLLPETSLRSWVAGARGDSSVR